MEKEKDNRSHIVKADYGTNDYYRFYKKKYRTEVSRLTYGQIVREFNEHTRDRLSHKGAGYIIPNGLGKIELRKMKTEVKIDDDGAIINHLPTNWKETRKLWNENEKARQKRVKIKFTNEHTDGHMFRIVYLRSKATYKNKSVYKMRFNRTMKRDLSKSIFQGRIDAFLK
tara:strand:+ start:3649 stop:4158 length:510 start_codon:yes stop_codon:yes gene_type:complete